MLRRSSVLLVAIALSLSGCLSVKPIEVKPIHITVDVNVRVEQALNDFFGEIDKSSSSLNTAN